MESESDPPLLVLIQWDVGPALLFYGSGNHEFYHERLSDEIDVIEDIRQYASEENASSDFERRMSDPFLERALLFLLLLQYRLQL